MGLTEPNGREIRAREGEACAASVWRRLASQRVPTWNQITDLLRSMRKLRESPGFAA